MDIDQVIKNWEADPEIATNLACWVRTPPKAADFANFPFDLEPILVQNLRAQGIEALFSHQAKAFELLKQGENLVIATGTASGKTLCYNLPVLDTLLKDSLGTALYLFPTKALAQDQVKHIQALIGRNERSNAIRVGIYDGDTPVNQRSDIRKNANILITNPDMLHQGILPHHTNWKRFLSGLRYVVIDEMHTYRGVFGSHIANVIRRLKRIAAFYGAFPQFVMTSATIGNPEELSLKLIEMPAAILKEDRRMVKRIS
jgi:DEAD/DEAH box helicase domain-containing protein